MKSLKLFPLFFLLFFLSCCSCGQNRRGEFRIAVDPNWYPLDFQAMQPYVNGFIEDFLLEISKHTGIEFEKIPANWDSLFQGLHEKKYDAVLSSLPPYNFNQAKYDFSKNFLDLGPVLVTPVDANHTDLQKLSGEVVGVIAGDPAVLVLQTYPDVIVRSYAAIPDALEAVMNGSIEAALINRLAVSNYVRDLFAGKLKISSGPLTEEGLHLLCNKDRQERFISQFNKSIEQLRKKGKLQALLKKWQLE